MAEVNRQRFICPNCSKRKNKNSNKLGKWKVYLTPKSVIFVCATCGTKIMQDRACMVCGAQVRFKFPKDSILDFDLRKFLLVINQPK